MCLKWEKEIEIPKLDSIYFITLKNPFIWNMCPIRNSNINANNEQIWHAKNWTIWLIFDNVI